MIRVLECWGRRNLRSPRFLSRNVRYDGQIRVSGEKILWEVPPLKQHAESQMFGLRRASIWSSAVNPLRYRRFGDSASNKDALTRDLMVKLWAVDKQRRVYRKKIKRRIAPQSLRDESFLDAALSFFRSPSLDGRTAQIVKQPSIRQNTGDLLLGRTPEVAILAPLLARADLLITRDVEWANVMFAFEQQNRYAMIDPLYPQSPVGFIREQSNVLFRQLLRSRRPFIAYVTDAMGNEIFRAFLVDQ